MKNQTALMLLFAFGVSLGFTQDPLFSHYQNSPNYVNPAMAGRDSCDALSFKYRHQWPQLLGDYRTTSTNWEHYHARSNGTSYLGIVTDNQADGAMVTNRLNLGYSQKFLIKQKLNIQVGLEWAYFQRSADWDKMSFADQIDSLNGFVNNTGDIPRDGNVSGLDLSAGVLMSYRRFFLGFSMHHFNEPNASVIGGNSPMRRKIGIQTGAQVEGNDFELEPYALYALQSGFSFFQLGINGIYRNRVLAGLAYRNQDAYIVTFGGRIGPLAVMYSYDRTVSILSGLTGGAHEASIAYKFWCKTPHEKFAVW